MENILSLRKHPDIMPHAITHANAIRSPGCYTIMILTLRSVLMALADSGWPSTLLLAPCRYCLGGKGGGDVVGETPNTGEVTVRLRDGNGGGGESNDKSPEGEEWAAIRVGSVDRGGGGGGVAKSWKQNKHKLYISIKKPQPVSAARRIRAFASRSFSGNRQWYLESDTHIESCRMPLADRLSSSHSVSIRTTFSFRLFRFRSIFLLELASLRSWKKKKTLSVPRRRVPLVFDVFHIQKSKCTLHFELWW